MKATLEFNLDGDNGDEALWEMTKQAESFYHSLTEFTSYIRNKLKYTEMPLAETEIYEEVKERFHDILDENNVSLEW
jgi:hypothetical protein